MDLNYFRENFDRMFDSSAEGLKRIRAIVENLRDFARLDEAEYKEVDLNAALRSTLEALHHEIEQRAVRVETSFQKLPPVTCHAGKINQVFLNVLLNAVQASANDGLIEVRTRPESEKTVIVEIEDHGVGISTENRTHLFEPFFTTKPVGGGDRARSLCQLQDCPRSQWFFRSRKHPRPGQPLSHPASFAGTGDHRRLGGDSRALIGRRN